MEFLEFLHVVLEHGFQTLGLKFGSTRMLNTKTGKQNTNLCLKILFSYRNINLYFAGNGRSRGIC